MKASNQQFEIGLGTLGTSKIIQTGSDYKLTKKKAKTYHQVKIEFLTWYISLKVEAASSRVGTHDLSPIFQSVSHAYQLCNKVSLKNLHGTKTWQKRRLSQPAMVGSGLPW